MVYELIVTFSNVFKSLVIEYKCCFIIQFYFWPKWMNTTMSGHLSFKLDRKRYLAEKRERAYFDLHEYILRCMKKPKLLNHEKVTKISNFGCLRSKFRFTRCWVNSGRPSIKTSCTVEKSAELGTMIMSWLIGYCARLATRRHLTCRWTRNHYSAW